MANAQAISALCVAQSHAQAPVSTRIIFMNSDVLARRRDRKTVVCTETEFRVEHQIPPNAAMPRDSWHVPEAYETVRPG